MIIPALVAVVGAQSYLELGTHLNETIGNVKAPKRFGVDINVVPCDGATMFKMTTAEFIAKHAATHAPYDVVFIDADHNAKSVASDFYGILPYVVHDGLVLLHDTNPETEADSAPGFCGDAWRFARTLHDERFECVTLPYHPGLTIVRNRFLWGPKP
jgi:predicted O-methyltransferase YrrM